MRRFAKKYLPLVLTASLLLPGCDLFKKEEPKSREQQGAEDVLFSIAARPGMDNAAIYQLRKNGVVYEASLTGYKYTEGLGWAETCLEGDYSEVYSSEPEQHVKACRPRYYSFPDITRKLLR